MIFLCVFDLSSTVLLVSVYVIYIYTWHLLSFRHFYILMIQRNSCLCKMLVVQWSKLMYESLTWSRRLAGGLNSSTAAALNGFRDVL